jgi:hypothetical protein
MNLQSLIAAIPAAVGFLISLVAGWYREYHWLIKCLWNVVVTFFRCRSVPVYSAPRMQGRNSSENVYVRVRNSTISVFADKRCSVEIALINGEKMSVEVSLLGENNNEFDVMR